MSIYNFILTVQRRGFLFDGNTKHNIALYASNKEERSAIIIQSLYRMSRQQHSYSELLFDKYEKQALDVETRYMINLENQYVEDCKQRREWNGCDERFDNCSSSDEDFIPF